MRSILLILAIMGGSFAAAGQSADVPAENSVGSVYLAKDDGTGRAGEPVAEFKATDVPIYCVVLLDSTTPSAVKMVFVAMNVPGIKPETKVVTSAYTTTEGQNRVNFTGRPDGKWIPGKYRVDIFINNKLADDVEFLILPGSKPPPPRAARSAAIKKPKPQGRPSNP